MFWKFWNSSRREEAKTGNPQPGGDGKGPPPIVHLLEDWPQPGSVSEAEVFATERGVVLRYSSVNGTTAFIHWPMVKIFTFGSPNDEALGGHPLAKFGLKFYQVHRIENSPWITELEKRNSVHPRHDKTRFLDGLSHYVLTFQDSTFECVARDNEHWKPEFQVFNPDEDTAAAEYWGKWVRYTPR